MIPDALRQPLHRLIAHPVFFLMAVNVACAGLGVVQLAALLSFLSPADFAVIGVFTAVAGIVTGLFDVRLVDLTTKLFYEKGGAGIDGQLAVLRTSLVLHVVLGLLVALPIAIGAMLAGELLMRREVATGWVLAFALRVMLSYPVNIITAALRLLGEFRLSGWLRLGTQFGALAALVGIVALFPTLDGYFWASASGMAMGLAAALATLALAMRTRARGSIVGRPDRATLARFLASRQFIIGGSMASFGKLLGRSADMLVVAALTSENVAGLYRVARQGYDTLTGLSDAVHQFYTPTLVDCIKSGRVDELAKHRNRLLLIGLGAAGGAILASWIVLRPIVATHYPQFAGALPAFEMFSGLLGISLGVHGWLWPSLVASGRVAEFGLLSVLGASVQLAGLAALDAWGTLDPASAAAAALLSACMVYGATLALVRRQTGPASHAR